MKIGPNKLVYSPSSHLRRLYHHRQKSLSLHWPNYCQILHVKYTMLLRLKNKDKDKIQQHSNSMRHDLIFVHQCMEYTIHIKRAHLPLFHITGGLASTAACAEFAKNPYDLMMAVARVLYASCSASGTSR